MMEPTYTPAANAAIPVGARLQARRYSQGTEHRRSLTLEVAFHNTSIYIIDQEYGGRTICPPLEDLRWLRDVLNRMTFCDHELDLTKPVWKSMPNHYRCSKCGDAVADPRMVETTLVVKL